MNEKEKKEKEIVPAKWKNLKESNLGKTQGIPLDLKIKIKKIVQEKVRESGKEKGES